MNEQTDIRAHGGTYAVTGHQGVLQLVLADDVIGELNVYFALGGQDLHEQGTMGCEVIHRPCTQDRGFVLEQQTLFIADFQILLQKLS